MTTHEAAGTHIKEMSTDLASEHNRILALVRRVQEASGLGVLAPLLHELHNLLMNHFAHEQYPGGFYDKIGAKGAEHQGTVNELIEDHNYMLSKLRSLVDRARSKSPGATDGLQDEVTSVVERLRAHEAKEQSLAEMLLSPKSA